MQIDLQQVSYAGFWTRFFATVLDTIILICVMVPLMLLFFGTAIITDPESVSGPMENILNNGAPALYSILFWHFRNATPGKMMMGISVVDSRTGGPVPPLRLVLRYVAYIVSALPLLLGFFWVAFDRRKQGFHDKIADTLVINNPGRTPAP